MSRGRSAHAIIPVVIFCAMMTSSAAASTPTSTNTILHDFISFPSGEFPQGALAIDASGNLYGVTEKGGSHAYGVVFKLTPSGNGQWTQAVVYNFTGGIDGGYPKAGVALDAAGNIYGTTYQGGNLTCEAPLGCGVVFEITPHGSAWSERVIHAFNGGVDGFFPVAPVTVDSAGNLFGTTQIGGSCGFNRTSGCGTVFKMSPSKMVLWTKSIIYQFQNTQDGAFPITGVILDANGNIFGTTPTTVYEISPATNNHWNETTLYSFAQSTNGGPNSQLIFDRVGNLYGTLSAPPGGYGGVFELSPSSGGWSENTIYLFNSVVEGYSPVGGVIVDSAGNLYGATAAGARGNGAVYRLSPSSTGGWLETNLYVFLGGTDGGGPNGGFIWDSAGNFYGATSAGGQIEVGAVFKMSPASNGYWSESPIYGFPSADGNSPNGSLVADGAGNLFGATEFGGDTTCSSTYLGYGCGTVYRLSRQDNGFWLRTILYSFKGGSDGYYPSGNLVFDPAGNLYGEASGGSSGYGFVYKLSPGAGGKWVRTILYAFQDGVDGSLPYGGMIFDAAGNLYGVAAGGTAGGWGVVFELAPTSSGQWTETTLYSFTGNSDGAIPAGSLVFDSAGDLYGATEYGGVGQVYFGLGTIFELSPASTGWTETTLHMFGQQGSDGYVPLGALIFDKLGNLYGTTWQGGSSSCNIGYYAGCGTVFELTRSAAGSWTESILLTFSGNGTGMGPQGNIVFDPAGNLYGVTQVGGTGNCGYQLYYPITTCGTVYELSPSGSGSGWTENVIYSFSGPDGYVPTGGLISDGAGNLYGGTSLGGNANDGVVFEVTP